MWNRTSINARTVLFALSGLFLNVFALTLSVITVLGLMLLCASALAEPFGIKAILGRASEATFQSGPLTILKFAGVTCGVSLCLLANLCLLRALNMLENRVQKDSLQSGMLTTGGGGYRPSFVCGWVVTLALACGVFVIYSTTILIIALSEPYGIAALSTYAQCSFGTTAGVQHEYLLLYAAMPVSTALLFVISLCIKALVPTRGKKGGTHIVGACP